MKRRYYPRELFPLVCIVCVQQFYANMSNTLYCSNKCCQEAYRQRKRAKEAVVGDQAEQLAGDQAGDHEQGE